MHARLIFTALAAAVMASASAADILIDFGMNGSTPSGFPDQRTTGTNPTWNNLAIGSSTGGAVNAPSAILIANNGGLPTLANAPLSDTTGAASGVSIAFTASGTKTAAIGTAGTGGIYTGTLPPVVTAAFPAATATKDSIYVNGVSPGIGLTITLTGLNNSQAYDLTALGARDGASAGGTWTLVTGTGATSRFQNSAGTFTPNTGQVMAHGGTNAAIAIQWLGVQPVAGSIAFKMTTVGPAVDLNALRIAPSAPAAPEEVDVYLLGGQSNMQGLANLNELTAAQTTAPANVSYWNGTSLEPLVPGTTVTSTAGKFGPELSFAAEISKRGRKACIVKHYDSGKPLDSGWNDQTWLGDSTGPGRVNFYPGLNANDPNQGTLYKNAMLPRYQAAIQAIIARGDIPVVRGLVWMQGEQDSKDAISAGRYAANLKRLRDRLAADLNLASPTNLPIVFGQVLPFEPAEPRFTNRSEIRTEMALADQGSGSPKAIPLCRMVSTDGYPVYPSPDAVHYTTPGQWSLGKAFAQGLAELTAKSLHLSFHHSATGTLAAMDPLVPPVAQGTRINTATNFWNNLAASAAHSFAGVSLKSSDGEDRGTLIGGTVGYVGTDANGWAAANKDAVVMDGWYGLGDTESMSVTNLPGDVAQRFHVVIYGDSNDISRTMNYTIGGVTRTIQDRTNFTGSFTEGGNYVVLSGLSGSSFTLTGNAAGSPRSAVNAISIIPGDPLSIDAFDATARYLQSGQQTTLSWSVANSDSVSISPAVGSVASAGSLVVSPSVTTTYTLTAHRRDETITRTLRIAVGPQRPNIVVFLVDDMGWQDTSLPFHHDAKGNPVVTGFNQRYRTPNMEALAASGVKFTNAYSASVCSPSRTALMTGQSPARHRVTQWTLSPNTDQSGTSATLKSPPDWNVNGIAPEADTNSARVWRTDDTLPRILHHAGYRTIHVGKAHFGADGLPGEDPLAQGFDVNIAGHAAGGPGSFLGTDNYGTGIFHVPGLEAYHGTNTFLTEALTLEANKAVEKSVEEGEPFYLYMSHYAVHVPLAVDSRFAGNYPGVDATETKYATMIEGMDKSLGDIRAKLQQLGVAENTLIIFYSDNGGHSASARGTTPSGTGANTHNKPLRAGKGSAYEGGTRVPAIASWATIDPANPLQQELPIQVNSRCDKPLVIEDLYPTLLDVAKAPIPAAIDGIDVTRYLKGDPSFTRSAPLLFHYPHIWENGLIGMNQGYEMHSSLRNGDWKVIHYYEGSRWELYNLTNDLGEANNLAASRPDLVFKYGREMIRLLGERNAVYPANRTTNLPQPPLLPGNATVDTDGDGRPDLDEDPNRNGIVDEGETDPDNADSDHDGTSDGAEIRLGTSPLDGASSFQVKPESVPDAPGMLRLTWPSLPGSAFTIRSSADLVDWSTVEVQDLPAAPEPARQTSHTLGPVPAGKRFYRVNVAW